MWVCVCGPCVCVLKCHCCKRASPSRCMFYELSSRGYGSSELRSLLFQQRFHHSCSLSTPHPFFFFFFTKQKGRILRIWRYLKHSPVCGYRLRSMTSQAHDSHYSPRALIAEGAFPSVWDHWDGGWQGSTLHWIHPPPTVAAWRLASPAVLLEQTNLRCLLTVSICGAYTVTCEL